MTKFGAATTEEDYCRRDSEGDMIMSSRAENILCFDGTLVSFHDLLAQRISELDLLSWYAPIDVIDQYQLFLDKNITTNDLYFWCNCTSETFGAQCEYTQISNKIDTVFLSIDVVTTNGTCYMGLPECNRNRIICLHWNQICDGKLFKIF
jgi:hypothetical protein